MVSLEKQNRTKKLPVSLVKEKVPQLERGFETPEIGAEVHDERSVEERVKAATESLQENIVYSSKEQDDSLLESWSRRNTTESADALRNLVQRDQLDLAAIPSHPNLLPNTQASIPSELRAYIDAGHSFRSGNLAQQSRNQEEHTAARIALQGEDKKRKVKNILSLGIGAKRRNQKYQAQVQRVDSYHANVDQQLKQHEQDIVAGQLQEVAQHRTTLETNIRSNSLIAAGRESEANRSDKTFEEDFDEVERRLLDTIKLSQESGSLKQSEVIAQLQASPEYTSALPNEQKDLLDHCERLVQEATQVEINMAQATDGMKLKKLVQERMSDRSPAGGKLDMSNFNAAANWYSSGNSHEGYWEPERTEALAKEVVKFGFDNGATVASLSPETIIRLATVELEQKRTSNA